MVKIIYLFFFYVEQHDDLMQQQAAEIKRLKRATIFPENYNCAFIEAKLRSFHRDSNIANFYAFVGTNVWQDGILQLMNAERDQA